MPKTKSGNAKTKGASSTIKKTDTGGQKQKGKTTGSSRKGYNQANARGNICYGSQAWASSSNLMCIIARVFNLTTIEKDIAKTIETTDDFIDYVKNLKRDAHFWDGWAIVKISNGCTGIAKVISGAGGAPSIDLKCTNLRMPEKRGAHIFYAESLQANQYKASILLDDTELEALHEVGLIPKKSNGTEGVEFITTQEGTQVSQVHFRLREAGQCINPNCRLPRKIAELIRKKEEQDVLEMKVETSYDTEDIIELGGQNYLSEEEETDEEDEADEEKNQNAEEDFI
jgi:hypothetical protein